MTTLSALVIVILLAAVGVLGDYFIKLSSKAPSFISNPPFYVGMIIYALTAVGWFFMMKYIKLSTLGVIYALTTVILLAIVGVIFFREHLSGYDLLGIVLGITALVLLTRFN